MQDGTLQHSSSAETESTPPASLFAGHTPNLLTKSFEIGMIMHAFCCQMHLKAS